MFDAAFQIFRGAFWPFVLVQAVVTIPVALVQALVLHQTLSAAPYAPSLAAVEHNIPWSILTVLLGIVQAAATAALAARAASGGTVSGFDGYSDVLRRIGPVLGFGIVAGLIVAALSVIVVIPGLIAFVFVAPGLLYVTVWGEGAFASISRSYALVQGHFWRISGVLVLSSLLVSVLNFIVSLIVAAFLHSPSILITETTVVGMLLGSFPIIALYVASADLRRRKGEPLTD